MRAINIKKILFLAIFLGLVGSFSNNASACQHHNKKMHYGHMKCCKNCNYHEHHHYHHHCECDHHHKKHHEHNKEHHNKQHHNKKHHNK